MDRATLKQNLKHYEAEFKKQHARNPTKADIAQNKEIAAQYKQYNRAKSTIPPVVLPAHSVPGLSKPSPRKIRTVPIDPKSWERVFDPNSKSTSEQELGPSPIKSNQKPFVPLLGHSPSSSSATTNLFAKFTASNDLSSNRGARESIEHEHPTLREVRGVKRSAEDPEVMPFEYDLPVKAAKLKKKSASRWENSDVSDDASAGELDDKNIGGGAKGKGRAKGKGKPNGKGTKGGEKVTKVRAAVGRGGKGYKKAKKGGAEVEEEDARELGVRKQLGGGVKSLHRKDAEGNVVLELELADGENEQGSEEEDEEMDEDGNGANRKSKKVEKITIHSRRPYHRDAAIIPIPTSTLSDDEDEDAEERAKDTTTLFYKDNHDLLLSQDVFAAATERRTDRQASVATPTQSDDEAESNDERVERRQNRSPSKSHTASQSLTHSLDPALLEFLSLRTSPSKSSSTSREKQRDLRVKKLLMEPLERGLHEKTAGGLEDLEVLERRRRGLGTRLDEDGGARSEEEEVDDDWEEEAEGWKDLGKGEMDDFDWDS